ncbi:MAG TPA: energy transducer TonB [Terracidiphilus sp.]
MLLFSNHPMTKDPSPVLCSRSLRAQIGSQNGLHERRKVEKSLQFAALFMLFIVGAAAAQQPVKQAEANLSGAATETEFRQLLVGKFLYLRGGYLDNTLAFNDRGALTGTSPRGSYTLNVVQVESLNLSKSRLELRCVRYGLHFLGVQPTAETASAVDRVRITPRKKWVRISIARMRVVKPPKQRKGAETVLQPPSPDATTTTSPAYAAAMLRRAVDNVFASTLDSRMMAAMPDFWQTYYKTTAANAGAAAPRVLRVAAVDRKPRLLTKLDAPSNQSAQDCGIAGLALYRALVGSDGTPQEVTVARPIGFGLDENAVAAIRAARFQPAMKDGRPVPVVLDLVVEFRIYSKRTAERMPEAGSKTSAPLPGPYSVEAQ